MQAKPLHSLLKTFIFISKIGEILIEIQVIEADKRGEATAIELVTGITNWRLGKASVKTLYIKKMIYRKRGFRNRSKASSHMVGTARFELTTSRTPSERATRLRYVPSNKFKD